MKKIFIALLTMVYSLLALTVCNKTSDNNDLLLLLGLGGSGTYFTKTVELSASPTAFQGPFNAGEFRHYQLMYKPADIGGSGNISSLSFRFNENSQPATCPHVTVKLGHIATTETDLSATMTANINQTKGSAETVLDDKTVKIPEGAADGYFEIPLDHEFNYNGVDNLVVDIERTSACSGGVMLKTGAASTAYTGRVYSMDSADPDTATPTSISNNPFHIKFKFAGGTNNVVNADMSGDDNSDIAPGFTGRTQMLVLASDINGKGTLTGIAINPNSVTGSAVVTGMSVSIAEVPSTFTELTSNTFDDNYGDATPVVVTRDFSYNVPAGQPSTVWIPFINRSFNYSGKNNLLIDISCTVSSGSYAVDYKNVPNNRVLWWNTPGATVGMLASRAFETVLRFAGGRVYVLPGVSSSSSPQVLGSGSAGQIQSLYRTSLLGTSGTITSVYVRLYNNTPSEASLTNYKLYMGHTTKTTFNVADTYASNMDDYKMVFNGTLAVPAGLRTGDWVKIRLHSSFVYDAVKNLSILFTSDAGPDNNSVFGSYSVTLLPNNSVGRGNNDVLPDGVPLWDWDGIVNVALDIK